MRSVYTAALAFVVIANGQTFAAITFFGGTDFRIQQVTDVPIGGSIYTATFHHANSYSSVYPTGPTFTTASEVNEAIASLREVINGLSADITGHTIADDNYLIPSGTDLGFSSDVDMASDVRNGGNTLSFSRSAAHGNDRTPATTVFGPTQAWVTFVPSGVNPPPIVPEPASLLVWGLFVAIASGQRFRRRETIRF